MKKKIITIFLIVIMICILPFAVYAVYSSIREIIADARTGSITIIDKNYAIYTYDDPSTPEIESSKITLPTNVINTEYSITSGRINCYATEKVAGSTVLEDYIQLNQLGLEFQFENSIDVFVRIRIEESWVSTRYYRNGTVRSQVILKDSSSLVDALRSNDNWIYDELNGYIYYKTKILQNEGAKNLEIKFDSDYFYQSESTNTYVEHVVVTLSYEIDIVQANRAERKWNVNLDDIFALGENTNG